MKTNISVILFILMSNLLFAQHLFKPSYNNGSGCSASGCHSFNDGIVTARLLDSVNVEVTVTGVTTGKKVAGELVNSSGIVVDFNNGTQTNPFILRASSADNYIVNAGFKNPSRQWDSASVNVTGGVGAPPDSGWQSNLIITEIMFDVPKNIEGDANGDGIRGSHSDEFIEFYNNSSSEIDVSGYQILDKYKVSVFTFPDNSILNSQQFAVVFGAVGTAGFGSNIPSGTLLFAVHENDDNNDGFSEGNHSNFKNSGDNVILVNPSTNDTLAEIYWGSAIPITSKPIYLAYPNTLSGSKISGAIGQSVTRKINSNLWDIHTVVSNDSTNFFSPGWNVAITTGIKTENSVPKLFVLFQNYPNPFNPSTIIKYSLAKAVNLKLKIYNILGNEIETLINNFEQSGTHQVTFNGASLSSGVYYYQLSTGSFSVTKKFMLLK